MKDDIRGLISRAQRLSLALPASGKMLCNTINILSAYADIALLADIFRENGALDLLLTLLASTDVTVRKSAGKMLRSLTTFDLSSRAYVLLHLSKSDSDQLTSLQGRQMLFDLFSDTASTGESEVLLKGITLPQVGHTPFIVLHEDSLSSNHSFCKDLLYSCLETRVYWPTATVAVN